MLTGKNEKSTSILAKVGNTASGVGSFLGRGAKALGWGIIYPIWPKNWFKSWDEMRYDIKNGGRYVIGSELEKYDPPIKTTQASENLGVEITEQKKGTGKVAFLASRTLTGDIPYLNDEQLGKIKAGLPNVTIFREENKIVIEINVKEISNTIKTNPDNKGKSEKKIKELVLKGIANKVDEDLKKLAGITGGEFKIHTDLKLLNGVAEKLYREYDGKSSGAAVSKKQQTSETAVPKKSLNTVEPNNEIITQNNMTNPPEMYHRQPEVIAARKVNGIRFSSKEHLINYEAVLRGHNIQLKDDVLTLEDASSEAAISSPSTPNHKQNKRGPGI